MASYPQEAHSWIRGVRHVITAVREKNTFTHIISFNPNDKALMLIFLSSPLNSAKKLRLWEFRKLAQDHSANKVREAGQQLRSFVFQRSCFCYSVSHIMLSVFSCLHLWTLSGQNSRAKQIRCFTFSYHWIILSLIPFLLAFADLIFKSFCHRQDMSQAWIGT